jgi:carbamoyltransferase
MTEPWILGIAASHNGAACLLHGDEIVVAVQEERLAREKRARVCGAKPSLAVAYCLESAGITAADLTAIALSAPWEGFKAPWNDVDVQPQLHVRRHGTSVLYVPHHLAHAASAFATSGFESSAVLVVDGAGSPFEELPDDERRAVHGGAGGGFESISLYFADRSGIACIEKQLCPYSWGDCNGGGTMPCFRSLGGMYSAAAYQIFGDGMEAGKVMGLAAYGKPDIPASDFLSVDEEATIVFHDLVPQRFAYDRRWPEMRKEYETLAASVQAALEAALLSLARRARVVTGATRLSYAGGVALNSVANERLVRESGFDEIHVIPAAEDAGTAIGAAYLAHWQLAGRTSTQRIARDSTGRTFRSQEIRAAIEATPFLTATQSHDVIKETVDLLCREKIGGWFQGGSEFGPRALGHRSIICDPRGATTKERLNARVKHREAFRPFAPAILEEATAQWLNFPRFCSPFMLRVCAFRPEAADRVPAVVHVDGTARLQTVTAESNPRFYALIAAFHAYTGIPMLLNTSFNVMGEPIVETPEDALWCLLATDLDFCVLGDYVVTKAAGYRSILDLTPRIAAYEVRVFHGQEQVPLSRDLAPNAVGSCAVQTRWGDVVHWVTREQLSLLTYIDGKRDGHEILCELTEDASAAAALITQLSTLRRLHVIAFGR